MGREDEKEYTDRKTSPLIDARELYCWSLYRAIIAEFVGTLFFMYISVSAVVGYKNEANKCNNIGVVGIAWVFGGMIFVSVYCIGGISGGHLNPAVTLGMVISRNSSLPRALMYVTAQCLGAICGVGLVKGISGSDNYYSNGGATNSVATGYTKASALGAEIMGSFVLVLTVLSSTDPKRKLVRDFDVPILAPLATGFAVFVVHLGTISIGGTGINPARSFGTAVIFNDHKAWSELVCVRFQLSYICIAISFLSFLWGHAVDLCGRTVDWIVHSYFIPPPCIE